MQRQLDAEDREGAGVAGEVVAAGQVDEAVGVVEPEGLRVGVRGRQQRGGVGQAVDEGVQQPPAEPLALVVGVDVQLAHLERVGQPALRRPAVEGGADLVVPPLPGLSVAQERRLLQPAAGLSEASDAVQPALRRASKKFVRNL